jgi:hypothetical protein
MSAPVRERPDGGKIELETAVNWPLVVTAIGLGFAGLTVVLGLGLLAAMRSVPGEEKQTARQTTVAAREQGVNWPAPPVPWSQLRDSLPQPPVVEPRAPEPAVPETPKHLPPPAVIVRKSSPTPAVQAVEAAAPAPVEAAEEVKAPAAPAFKRHGPHSSYNESELLQALQRVTREIDIETEKGTSAKLLEEMKKAPRPEAAARGDKDAPHPLAKAQPVLELLAKRDDLKGLPVRNGAECQTGAKEARAIQELSREVRQSAGRLGRSGSSSVSHSEVIHRDVELIRYLEGLQKRAAWLDVTVRTLVQMMQAENAPVRLQLVKNLSAIKGEKASADLAQRAVFDLDAEVREVAVKALKDRPAEEYRPVLLAGLRYPWAATADHAAEALVNLDDRAAVGALVDLLDQPDPQAPVLNKAKKWVAPELVRVNHLQNCLLCHAPSFDRNEPVRGLVPERDQPLPVVYYEKGTGTFVRADVTYLKQDFSTLQPVAEHGQWPHMQRYDYLIRQRELSKEEAARLLKADGAAPDKPSSYPQREAVLWALRELTGEDMGNKSDDWYLFLQGENP